MAPWDRRDTALAIVLAAAALATRWAVRAHSFYSYDTGLLASGIQDFDFDREFPHPPYYPLTIAAGKLLAHWMSPLQALVALAVASSAAMCAGTYAVARQLGDRPTAMFAALLVLLSPTALLNGAVGLSYGLEGAASAAVAWTAWRLRTSPSPTAGLFAGAVLSVAVGIRPSTAVFLGPVVLWAAWRDRRALAATVAAGAAVSLAWFVPMLVAGGGWSDFVTYNGYQTRHVILPWTVFSAGGAAVAEHLDRLASFVPVELPFLAGVAVVGIATAWVSRDALRGDPGRFLLAWSLPALLFYALVYVGWPVYPTGYVMVLAPAIAILIARILAAAARGVWGSGAPRPAIAVACALLVVVAVMPAAWALRWDETMAPQRAADQRERDYAHLADAFPPNETALLTFIQWHWARLNQPDYLVWGVRPYWNDTSGSLLMQVAEGRFGKVDRPTSQDFLDGEFEPPHPIPSWVRTILVLDEGQSGRDLLKAGVPVREDRLPSGRPVLVFDASGIDNIEATLRWFDDAGRLDPTTLDPEDRRGHD